MTEARNVVTAVLVLTALSLPPLLGASDKVLTTALLAFVIASLASSWNIVGGFAGQINLGHAVFFGIGALATRGLWLNGFPVLLALASAAIVAFLAALILGLPGLRLQGVFFAVGTLAMAEAVRITINNLFPQLSALPAHALRSYELTSRYYLALGVLAVTVASAYWLNHSRAGLAMLSLRDDEVAASASGVNVFRFKLLAFAVSAVLASLAGGSFAYFHVSYYPALPFAPEWTFEALVVTFIGGAGTVAGPLIGAAFFVLTRDLLAANLAGYHLLSFGVLFVIVVLLVPGGFTELWRKHSIRRREN